MVQEFHFSNVILTVQSIFVIPSVDWSLKHLGWVSASSVGFNDSHTKDSAEDF